MSVSSRVLADKNKVEIRISGRFGFSDHKDFRAACDQDEPTKIEYVIDMSEAEYMDSAALGMLLVLRERAGNDAAKITLRGARAEIQQILDISRFDQLFTIES